MITALSLPTSAVAAFIAVWLCGFTLNFMTLLGLSLAIGVLIDDAIVVRENIVRHMERGEDRVTAARNGTAEIGVASAMSAAFVAQAMDRAPLVIENAAESALEHHLGMTCDPVAGDVQVPCIERCAFGAV